jgi:hypothetical protein
MGSARIVALWWGASVPIALVLAHALRTGRGRLLPVGAVVSARAALALVAAGIAIVGAASVIDHARVRTVVDEASALPVPPLLPELRLLPSLPAPAPTPAAAPEITPAVEAAAPVQHAAAAAASTPAPPPVLAAAAALPVPARDVVAEVRRSRGKSAAHRSLRSWRARPSDRTRPRGR